MDTIYIKNFMTSIFGNSESDRILNIEGRTEEAITKLLDVLPKEQRELLDMRYQGYGLDVAAASMGITVEKAKQLEALGLRTLRHPHQSRQLKDFFYYYSSEFKHAKLERISLDITMYASFAITGNRTDAIDVKNKLVNDFKGCDKGFMDFYESNDCESTKDILSKILLVSEERQKLFKSWGCSYIHEYNSSHLRPEQKIHNIVVVIEAFDRTSEDLEVQELIHSIIRNGYMLGIHLIYVTDSEDHQIAVSSAETVMLDVETKDRITMIDDWNPVMTISM